MNIGDTGKKGEEMVARFLREKGLNLVKRNFVTRFGEIDIIAEDEITKTAEFFEVKRQKDRIDIEVLKAKAGVFNKTAARFDKYKISFNSLGLEDM